MADAVERIAVIGGGIAGLALAWKLAQNNNRVSGKRVEITIYERAERLGGRAGSFGFNPSVDSSKSPVSSSSVCDSSAWLHGSEINQTTPVNLDYCPHVFMNCCEQFGRWLDQTGLKRYWTCHEVLYFHSPETGRFQPFRETPILAWLSRISPTLGLTRYIPSLFRLDYLDLGEKRQLCGDLLALRRDHSFNGTFDEWLNRRGVGTRLKARFWEPVVLGALSCELSEASFHFARMVFVKAFLEKSGGWFFWTPNVPLAEIFDVHLGRILADLGVIIHRGCGVRSILTDGDVVSGLELRRSKAGSGSDSGSGSGSGSGFDSIDQAHVQYDRYYLAVDFFTAERLLPSLAAGNHSVGSGEEVFVPKAISTVHLWTDRPIIPVPNAVFCDRTIQWLFAGGEPMGRNGFYSCAIVSSSDRFLTSDVDLCTMVLSEIKQLNPHAEILQVKPVNYRRAVFMPSETNRRGREKYVCPYRNMRFVGDWPATGWPATMESAVQSTEYVDLSKVF